jgi:hypothetical protein
VRTVRRWGRTRVGRGEEIQLLVAVGVAVDHLAQAVPSSAAGATGHGPGRRRCVQPSSRIAVGRNGQVSDGADLITYLCGEQPAYIIGATYDVNGGSHIH